MENRKRTGTDSSFLLRVPMGLADLPAKSSSFPVLSCTDDQLSVEVLCQPYNLTIQFIVPHETFDTRCSQQRVL